MNELRPITTTPNKGRVAIPDFSSRLVRQVRVLARCKIFYVAIPDFSSRLVRDLFSFLLKKHESYVAIPDFSSRLVQEAQERLCSLLRAFAIAEFYS